MLRLCIKLHNQGRRQHNVKIIQLVPSTCSNQVWYFSHLVCGNMEEFYMKWRRKFFCILHWKSCRSLPFTFLLSNSVKRTLGFMCDSMLYSLFETPICMSRNRLPAFSNIQNVMYLNLPFWNHTLIRQVCVGLWPGWACCLSIKHTSITKIWLFCV